MTDGPGYWLAVLMLLYSGFAAAVGMGLHIVQAYGWLRKCDDYDIAWLALVWVLTVPVMLVAIIVAAWRRLMKRVLSL